MDPYQSCTNIQALMQQHTEAYTNIRALVQQHAATYRGLHKKLSLLKVEFTFSFEHVLTLETQDLFKTKVTALTVTKNKL